jgi:hypothetical protein
MFENIKNSEWLDNNMHKIIMLGKILFLIYNIYALIFLTPWDIIIAAFK